MEWLNELRKKNEELLKSVSIEEKPKYDIIKELLIPDDCFFNLPTKYAMSIIVELGYSREESNTIYKELISSDAYNSTKQYEKIKKY